MMDVEKQSNGSDCGVLAIAYAFDLCSGLNPCTVRFDHSKIRSHLATCLENCQVSRFPALGERKSAVRKPKTVELHCSCQRRKVMRWHSVMCAMSGITATAWTFPVRCLVSLRSTGSVRDVYMSNEQSESEPCLLLLKVYLPACSSHIVATSNHTRVCLHSRELLSFPTPRVVCIIMHFICLCVLK